MTGPLWRVIKESGHVSDMNKHYPAMQECFTRWSGDSTQVMCGDDVVFKGKHNPTDPIFTSLVTPNSDLDEMTKQVLELIFITFCQVTEKMLEDRLQQKCRKNVGVEQDFGMLDRIIMHLKPKASMLVYERIIMNVQNKTSEWRKGLSVTDREAVVEYARRRRQK